MAGPIKIPVGSERGKLIGDVTVAQLEAACDSVDNKLCEAVKGSDRAKGLKAFVSAARKLLQQRKFPTGTYTSTEDANRALRDASEVGWLLSPGDQVANLLPGTAIVVSAFRVDVVLDTFESDDDPGRRVPGKSMLDNVVRALDISWTPALCHRTDNQRSPYVRAFQAAGRVRNFDLKEREIQAHGEVDLTEGSALCRKLQTKINDVRRARLEIERRRAYITSHADTSARLRAIRAGAVGLRESYLPGELAKPFFCAKVSFTGKAENAASQAVFDGAIAQAFVPSVDAVFGPGKRAAGDR